MHMVRMEIKSIKLNVIANALLKGSMIILPLITFPYITRTVHAEKYGILAICYSIISYFDMFAALGINVYAIREGARLRNDREKISQFSSEVFSINILSTLLSYLALIVLIYLWKPGADYKKILFIYSIEIIATTISVEWIYNIFEEYVYITIRTIALQTIKIIMIFALIKQESDFYLSAAIDALFFLSLGIINFLRSKRYVDLKLILSKKIFVHLKSILVLFANTLMISIYVNLDITMLGLMQGDFVTGVYKFTTKKYSAVNAMINGITVVFIPRLSNYIGHNKKGQYDDLLNKLLLALLVVVAPLAIGLIMTSRNVLLLVSGEEYLSGSISLIILAFTLCIAMVSNVLLNAVLIIFHREKKALQITTLSSVINVVLNLIFIPIFSLNGAAFTTLLSELTVMILALFSVRDILKIKIEIGVIINVLLGCIAIICDCLFVDTISFSNTMCLFIKVVVSGLVYVLILLPNRTLRQRFMIRK